MSFTVTPADLGALAGSLSGLLSDLEAAASSMRSVDLGAPENSLLSGALDAFVDEWFLGIGQSRARLEQLATRLAAAGDNYRSVDESVASSI
jgi:hypothetical protein